MCESKLLLPLIERRITNREDYTNYIRLYVRYDVRIHIVRAYTYNVLMETTVYAVISILRLKVIQSFYIAWRICLSLKMNTVLHTDGLFPLPGLNINRQRALNFLFFIFLFFQTGSYTKKKKRGGGGLERYIYSRINESWNKNSPFNDRFNCAIRTLACRKPNFSVYKVVAHSLTTSF